MTKPAKFFDDETEPEVLCRNCEYFAGGGLGSNGVPILFGGDCLNRASPRFTTNADQTCDKFFPCTTPAGLMRITTNGKLGRG